MILSTPEHFQQPAIQGTVGPDRKYNLTDDYCFEWTGTKGPEKGKRYRRTVFRVDPACDCLSESDLASVPGFGAPLGFEVAGPSDAGGIIHDHDYFRLFTKHSLGYFMPGEFQIFDENLSDWVDCTEPYTRARADAGYRWRISLGGMSKYKAWIEWISLRVGAKVSGITWRAYFS